MEGKGGTIGARVRVTEMKLFDQDEAALSEGEATEETEREQEELVLEGLQRGDSGHWELRRLQRQECIGVFSVHKDAGEDLDVRSRV